MKKFFFLCAAVFALTANAEEIVLDLSTATDYDGTPVVYETADMPVWNGNIKDVWNMTLSDSTAACQVKANDGIFLFGHSGDPTYSSWGGFTISKNAADTLNQFACAARGGVNGEGTPFMMGYYEEYLGVPLQIVFDTVYKPIEVYICQNMVTLLSMQNGDGYAKQFTDQDTLALIITGTLSSAKESEPVVYYLAAGDVFNQGWVKVDLSPIGNSVALNFRMTSTDVDPTFGMKTPSYFALDGLKIGNITTDITTPKQPDIIPIKRIVNGQLLIERNGNIYNAAGQLISNL